MQKHLFIIDSLSSLNFKLDSSLRMSMELCKRGQKVFICEIGHLSWRLQSGSPQVIAQEIQFEIDSIESIKLKHTQTYELKQFNAIHMRKEPPVEDKFITATWILDAVKDDCWVFNNPSTLRTLNEKMSIFQFKHYVSDALVSANAFQILDFIKDNCNGDAVVKPLNLFGGKGIFRINLKEMSKEEALDRLNEVTEKNQITKIVQPFNSQIFSGEVRAFAVGGQTMSWCLKVPKQGNFMANTSQGAVLKQFEPNDKLKNMVHEINQKLLAMGVYFVGYDIIGDNISEINITSPRLLVPTGDEYNYYRDVIDWTIEKCKISPSKIG